MSELSELELKAVITAGWISNTNPTFFVDLPFGVGMSVNYLAGDSVTKQIASAAVNADVSPEQAFFVLAVLFAAGVDVAGLYSQALTQLALQSNMPTPQVPSIPTVFTNTFAGYSA